MPLNLRGYELVDARKPVVQTGGPRDKFKRGVEYQIALLGGLREFKGKELIDNKGKLKVRKWYWQKGEGYLTDVRYGNVSLLEEGKAYALPSKEALEQFYQTLKEECDKGALDDAIGKAAERMPRAGSTPTVSTKKRGRAVPA